MKTLEGRMRVLVSFLVLSALAMVAAMPVMDVDDAAGYNVGNCALRAEQYK